MTQFTVYRIPYPFQEGETHPTVTHLVDMCRSSEVPSGAEILAEFVQRDTDAIGIPLSEAEFMEEGDTEEQVGVMEGELERMSKEDDEADDEYVKPELGFDTWLQNNP